MNIKNPIFQEPNVEIGQHRFVSDKDYEKVNLKYRCNPKMQPIGASAGARRGPFRRLANLLPGSHFIGMYG